MKICGCEYLRIEADGVRAGVSVRGGDGFAEAHGVGVGIDDVGCVVDDEGAEEAAGFEGFEA